MENAPLVGLVMGSDSDWPLVSKAHETLAELGVPHEVRVMSAHRTPDLAHEYSATAEARGLKVILAAAGGAAHLAGVLAAGTTLPVIGIPVPGGSLGGLEALLATVQMPSGIPVRSRRSLFPPPAPPTPRSSPRRSSRSPTLRSRSASARASGSCTTRSSPRTRSSSRSSSPRTTRCRRP